MYMYIVPYLTRIVYSLIPQVRFYVIEKATGKVVDSHFSAPACMVFHHINTYEEDGKLKYMS